jgi:hypothetical protein
MPSTVYYCRLCMYGLLNLWIIHIKLLFKRFEVFTVVKILIIIIWVVTPCNCIGGYQQFEGLYLLHHQKFYFICHCLMDICTKRDCTLSHTVACKLRFHSITSSLHVLWYDLQQIIYYSGTLGVKRRYKEYTIFLPSIMIQLHAINLQSINLASP